MSEDLDSTAGLAGQRALVGVRRRRRLFQLAADYRRLLRDEYPDLSEIISTHVADVLDHARRTRAAERADIIGALARWGSPGLSFDDLLDETELSAWTLRTVLRDLAHECPPVVGYMHRAPVGGLGRPCRVYFLLA